MAYIPPLNGGRLNASIGGNSTSAGAGYTLASTGTLFLAGGNNITLSQNGNSVSIVGGAGGGGGIALANSQTTYTSGTANLLEGGGAITIASTTGQKFNLSVPAQSTLSATGALSLSTNGSTISIGVPAFSAGINTLGNTAGTTGTVSNQLILAGGNNVTLSQATGAGGNTITISAGAQSAQTQNNIQAVYDGTNGISTGTIRFSNSNGVGFGINGQTITASHNGITSQTNQTQGFTAGTTNAGNTSLTSTGTFDARSVYLNAHGIVSAGFSSSSLFVSATQSGQAFSGSNGSFAFQTATFGSSNGMHFYTTNGSIVGSYTMPTLTHGINTSTAGGGTGGGSTTASGGMMLVAGSNITLSATTNASGAQVTIYGGAGGPGGGGVALYDGANSITSGTASLSGVGALTASINGQTLSLSAPATSSLSATGAISISTNGSTISLGAPASSSFSATGGVSLSTNGSTISIGVPMATLSRWEYPNDGFAAINTAVGSAGSLSVQPMYVPFNVSGTAAKIVGSMSVATHNSATTASVNISVWMGIYSLNGSTLSLASSGSANNGYTWLRSGSSSQYTSSYAGLRQLTVPMTVNMTPGQWWIAALVRTATTYTSMPAITLYGKTALPTGAGSVMVAPLGVNTTAASNVRDVMLFQGVYTATASAGPSTIVSGQINNTGASMVQQANFYNAIYNATY